MNHFEGNENEVSTGVCLFSFGSPLDYYHCYHIKGLCNHGRRLPQFGRFDIGIKINVLGSYVANRITNKIEQIDDRIFMCRSGSAADTQKIGNIIRQNLDFFKY